MYFAHVGRSRCTKTFYSDGREAALAVCVRMQEIGRYVWHFNSSSYFRLQRFRCGHEVDIPDLDMVGESCGGWTTRDVAGGRTKMQYKVCMAGNMSVAHAQAACES